MIIKKIKMLIMVSICLIGTHNVWADAAVEKIAAVQLAHSETQTLKSDVADEIKKSVLKRIESDPGHFAEKIALQYPQQVNIDQQITAIKRRFLIDKLKRYGCRAIGTIAVAYTAYRTLQLLNIIPHTAISNDSTAVDKTPAPTPVVTTDVGKLQADLKELKESLSPSTWSIKWFKNKTSVIADIAAGIIFSQIVNTKVNASIEPGGLFHRDHGSIKWFVQQTSLLGSIEELKQYVMVLDGPSSESGHNREMYEYFILSATNSVVKNLESIIGFIEYKQSKLSGTDATEINEIARFLFNTTSDFCSKIDAVLADKSIDAYTRKNKMEALINDLKGEITRLIMSFARIEAEKGV